MYWQSVVLCAISLGGKKQILVMGYEVDRVHKMPTMVYEVQAKRCHLPSALSCHDEQAKQRDYVRRVSISGSRVWMGKEQQYLHCCCWFVSILVQLVDHLSTTIIGCAKTRCLTALLLSLVLSFQIAPSVQPDPASHSAIWFDIIFIFFFSSHSTRFLPIFQFYTNAASNGVYVWLLVRALS